METISQLNTGCSFSSKPRNSLIRTDSVSTKQDTIVFDRTDKNEGISPDVLYL